jgi:hypothetical protein
MTINRAPLTAKKAEINTAKAKADTALLADNPKRLPNRQKSITETIAALRNQLDAPSKRYQTYLQQLRTWDARKKEIDGSADIAGTLRYFEAQLE